MNSTINVMLYGCGIVVICLLIVLPVVLMSPKKEVGLPVKTVVFEQGKVKVYLFLADGYRNFVVINEETGAVGIK